VNISNVSVLHLAKFCHKIKTLVLSYVPKLTDSAIIALAQNLHTLRSLDLTGDIKLSDRSVNAIARYLPLIQYICLRHCSNITNRALHNLESTHLSKSAEFSMDSNILVEELRNVQEDPRFKDLMEKRLTALKTPKKPVPRIDEVKGELHTKIMPVRKNVDQKHKQRVERSMLAELTEKKRVYDTYSKKYPYAELMGGKRLPQCDPVNLEVLREKKQHKIALW